MNEFCTTRSKMEKLAVTISKLKQEVNSPQEKTTEDFTSKINCSSYQFKKKGHEEQFNCNANVKDTISSAKIQLLKVSENPADMAPLNKVASLFKEGTKAILKQEKLIKVADRSSLVNYFVFLTPMLLLTSLTLIASTRQPNIASMKNAFMRLSMGALVSQFSSHQVV